MMRASDHERIINYDWPNMQNNISKREDMYN